MVVRFFAYAICIPFILAGLAIAIYGLIVIRQASRSTNWPRVDGQITTSEISCRDGNYAPTIVYTYSVAGELHHGTEIGFGNRVSSSDGRHASTYCGKYPVGAIVSVYFDPEDTK